MKTGRKDCDMTNRRKIVNEWAWCDPDEPAEIPPEFSKGIYRSVYFPPGKALLCYQAGRMVKQFDGTSMNEACVEGLRLWVEKNMPRYLETIQNKVDQRWYKCHAKAEDSKEPDDQLKGRRMNLQMTRNQLNTEIAHHRAAAEPALARDLLQVVDKYFRRH